MYDFVMVTKNIRSGSNWLYGFFDKLYRNITLEISYTPRFPTVW